jgi:hypothetical protein
MAVLGAVAGFFAGLSLGAFCLDGPIRRARSPQIVYASLEAVIGFWGLVSVWLLPAAGRIIAPLLGTQPTPTLHWAISFALPALVRNPRAHGRSPQCFQASSPTTQCADPVLCVDHGSVTSEPSSK